MRVKNTNAAVAKLKQKIGFCVASIHKLARSQEWLESPKQKFLLGEAVKNSKEPVWPGNFSPTEPDKNICDTCENGNEIQQRGS